MFKKTIVVAALALAAASSPVLAGDDNVIGALLGAGVGAVIGHGVGGDRGAVIGGAVGAVAGASIADTDGRYERTHYEAPRAYYPPPAMRYYNEVSVFERRGPVVVEQIAYPPQRHRHWREYRRNPRHHWGHHDGDRRDNGWRGDR